MPLCLVIPSGKHACDLWVDSCRPRIPNQIPENLHKRNSTCSERRGGFRITIFDDRTRGDNSKPRLERVVVAGE